MKKRILAALLAVLLLLGAAGCAKTVEPTSGLKIVTTIFPIYDWVRVITGDESSVELTWLLDSGVDLHSYQATAEDIARISECDIFIYIGGESDAWVEDAIAQAKNEDMVALNLMDSLGSVVSLAEIADGDGTEYDEHIWLSIQDVRIMVAYIAAVMEEKDQAHSQTYAENTLAYIAQLGVLDGEYLAALHSADLDTLVFGDRFPFRYLTDDYGLTYYAAFSGCSAETEASFETILNLTEKVDELGLPAVIALDGSDHSIAETIAENCASSPAVLTLDSMQSVTAKDVEEGATYLSIMESNLEVLKQALNTD